MAFDEELALSLALYRKLDTMAATAGALAATIERQEFTIQWWDEIDTGVRRLSDLHLDRKDSSS
jgi:hypothetical protein